MIPAILITWWLALHPSPGEVEGLRARFPVELTTETAREHLVAARAASVTTTWTVPWGDGTLVLHPSEGELLYIAWHESRFRASTRTREPGHKTSCGVMTPVPMRRCRAGRTLMEQYKIGAEHLGGWYAQCGVHRSNPFGGHVHLDNGLHQKCALTGYAGGNALIRACRKGGHMWRRRGKRRVDLCATWREYEDGGLDVLDAIDRGSRAP